VILQALLWKESIGRSIDIASKSAKVFQSSSQDSNKKDGKLVLSGGFSSADGDIVNDWLRFWSRPGNCLYPADFDDLSFK
jgi:hypothetical protein